MFETLYYFYFGAKHRPVKPCQTPDMGAGFPGGWNFIPTPVPMTHAGFKTCDIP